MSNNNNYRAIMEAMIVRPRMYASSINSFEEQFLLLLSLADHNLVNLYWKYCFSKHRKNTNFAPEVSTYEAMTEHLKEFYEAEVKL